MELLCSRRTPAMASQVKKQSQVKEGSLLGTLFRIVNPPSTSKSAPLIGLQREMITGRPALRDERVLDVAGWRLIVDGEASGD
jgi:hypothetical protein